MSNFAQGGRSLNRERHMQVLCRPSPYPLPLRFAGGEEALR